MTVSIPFGVQALDDLSIVIPVQPVIEILVVRHRVLCATPLPTHAPRFGAASGSVP